MYVYMCVCVFICMHIYVSKYIYIYMCVWIHMSVSVYICIYMSTYVYAYIYMCVCVCVYVCMYLYVHIHMSVSMCVYIYIYIYVCVYNYIYIFIYMSVRIHMHLCVCVCVCDFFVEPWCSTETTWIRNSTIKPGMVFFSRRANRLNLNGVLSNPLPQTNRAFDDFFDSMVWSNFLPISLLTYKYVNNEFKCKRRIPTVSVSVTAWQSFIFLCYPTQENVSEKANTR